MADAVKNAVNDLALPELYAELSKTGRRLRRGGAPVPGCTHGHARSRGAVLAENGLTLVPRRAGHAAARARPR
jgi:hypothetical protein